MNAGDTMNKAQSDPLHYVVLAAILLVVAFIVVLIFRTTFSKEHEAVGTTLGEVTSKKDYDNDGIFDLFDSCPCTNDSPAGTFPEVDARGCGYDPKNDKAFEKLNSAQLKTCKEKITEKK